MPRRIVKVINTYDGSEKWRIQWRVPLFGWWWYEETDWGINVFDTYAECEKELMQREKNSAKEIVKVEKTL